MDLIIGTASENLYVVRRGVSQRLWATPSPSFVTEVGDQLYAVSEHGTGLVARFGGHSAAPLATISSGGSGPCHVSVHPSKQWLYVANYGDGTARAIELLADGGFGESYVDLSHAGSGPNSDRQEGPHAHFTALSPSGNFLVITDLGTDELRIHAVDEFGKPERKVQLSKLPAGSGPRHVAWLGELLVVAGELSGEVYWGTWHEEGDQAWFELVGQTPASTGRLRQLSHIEFHDEHIFVGVRGANTIGVLGRTRAGGQLDGWELVAEVPTAQWPRHFAMVGEGAQKTLIVTGERAGLLAYHSWDGATLSRAHTLVPVAAPQCIVPSSLLK